MSVLVLIIDYVSYEAHRFNVFSINQDIMWQLEVEQLEGYTIAIITARAPRQHMWASPGSWPDPKCSKAEEV